MDCIVKLTSMASLRVWTSIAVQLSLKSKAPYRLGLPAPYIERAPGAIRWKAQRREIFTSRTGSTGWRTPIGSTFSRMKTKRIRVKTRAARLGNGPASPGSGYNTLLGANPTASCRTSNQEAASHRSPLRSEATLAWECSPSSRPCSSASLTWTTSPLPSRLMYLGLTTHLGKPADDNATTPSGNQGHRQPPSRSS